MVGAYESNLRQAEEHIKCAIGSIGSLRGTRELSEVRRNLGEALALVQYTLHGAHRINKETKND